MRLDLTVIGLSFLTVAGAELGCLARTAALAARYGDPGSVVLGTLLANLLLLLPVWFGAGWLHQHLPEAGVRGVSAGLFAAMALWFLWGPGHAH